MSERELAAADPLTAARLVLGARLTSGPVTVRVVEVEAYGSDEAGPWPDPAAHSYPGPTRRNAVMFGPAGRLYVYLSHGLHLCVNVTCADVGTAGAVLLRAAEVVDGGDVVRRRRGAGRRDRDLARGRGTSGRRSESPWRTTGPICSRPDLRSGCDSTRCAITQRAPVSA